MNDFRIYSIIGAGILLGALAGWLIPGLFVPAGIVIGSGVGVACGVGYQRGGRHGQNDVDADPPPDE